MRILNYGANVPYFDFNHSADLTTFRRRRELRGCPLGLGWTWDGSRHSACLKDLSLPCHGVLNTGADGGRGDCHDKGSEQPNPKMQAKPSLLILATTPGSYLSNHKALFVARVGAVVHCPCPFTLIQTLMESLLAGALICTSD